VALFVDGFLCAGRGSAWEDGGVPTGCCAIHAAGDALTARRACRSAEGLFESLLAEAFDMPYRGDAFVQGQYYHLYNRGAGKGKIFFNDGNYLYLLRLIKEHAPKFGVTVIAYCLMPNHYHFLLRQETEILLSKFMGRVP